MNKYTAEQVEETRRITPGIRGEMLDELVALLRERESAKAAKAAITDEIVHAALTEYYGGEPHPNCTPSMRAALEAVAPMLASARAPEGWQLVPVEPTVEMMRAGDDTGFHTYTGTWSITPDACWQAMLAAAPKPETKE